ncbi:MAG: DUF167 domain-containing protein [Candidatus Micrarchaeota archaeon]|nr:DUF167 domain-containing protein [Candidatus Micrarchaeota archaeon]
MKVDVKVHPHSKSVMLKSGDVWDVYLTEPAEHNRANRQLLSVLKSALGCDVSLISGHTSRKKTVLLGLGEEEYNALKEKYRH